MLILKVLAGPIIGAVLAGAVTLTLVSSQTSAPDKNPADEAAISYGQ